MADTTVSDRLGEACLDVRDTSWGLCLFAAQTCHVSRQLHTQARRVRATSQALRETSVRMRSSRP
jgi:hypothetical protein